MPKSACRLPKMAHNGSAGGLHGASANRVTFTVPKALADRGKMTQSFRPAFDTFCLLDLQEQTLVYCP